MSGHAVIGLAAALGDARDPGAVWSAGGPGAPRAEAAADTLVGALRLARAAIARAGLSSRRVGIVVSGGPADLAAELGARLDLVGPAEDHAADVPASLRAAGRLIDEGSSESAIVVVPADDGSGDGVALALGAGDDPRAIARVEASDGTSAGMAFDTTGADGRAAPVLACLAVRYASRPSAGRRTPWLAAGGRRRARLTGPSGALDVVPAPGASAPCDAPTELLLASDDDARALAARLEALSERADAGVSPADLVAAERPGHGRTRVAVLAGDAREMAERLREAASIVREGGSRERRARVAVGVAPERPGDVAFMFPGEGSQEPGMLEGLWEAAPRLREWFEELDERLERLGIPSLGPDLYPAPGSTRDARAAARSRMLGPRGGSQSLLVAGVAMSQILTELGVVPAATIAHSSGEHAALVASGLVPGDDREAVIERVAAITEGQVAAEAAGLVPRGRAVAFAGVDVERVAATVAATPDVHMVAVNAPTQSIVWGSPDAVAGVVGDLAGAGGLALPVPSDRGYHTPGYAPRAREMRREYDRVPIGRARIPAWSGALAAPLPDDPDAIRDALADQWTRPVRFADTVRAANAAGISILLEVGPGARLAGFAGETLRGTDALTLSACPPGLGALEGLLWTLARVFIRGVPVDATPLRAVRDRWAPLGDPAPLADPPPDPPGVPERDVEPSAPIGSAGPPADPEPPAPPPLAPPASDRRAALVDAHMALMDDFLRHQERVVAMAARVVTPSGAPPPPASASVVPAPRRTTESTARERLPLIGTIVERGATRLYAERTLSADEDEFLRDHAIGGLPVVPFTVSMAMVAQAGRALAGAGRVVAELRELRGYRWIALDDGPIVLGVSAELAEPDADGATRVHVRLTLPAGVTDGAPPTAFEGTCVLRASFAPGGADRPAGGPSEPSGPDDGLYAAMFHGESFRCIERVESMGPAGIAAVGRRRPPAAGLREPAGGEPDPQLLDGCGQLIAHWLVTETGRRVGVFPFRVRSYRVHAELPPPGARIALRAGARVVDERTTDASIDLVDESGLVIARLEGLEQRMFAFPPAYLECLLRPEESMLSHAWRPDADGPALRRIDPLPAGFLDEGWAIWSRVLAHMSLTPPERRRWYDMRARADRRIEWLLGRVAAKDAVRAWAAEHHGLTLAAHDIEITSDGRGAPGVSCAAVEAVGPVPAVGLTHSRGVVLAAVADPGARVGVDLERTDPRAAPRDLLAAFTPGEQRLAMAAPEAVTVLWCAKEAAAKAMGLGLGGAPRRWPVVAYDPDTGMAAVTHEGARLPVRVWSREDETVAVCGPLRTTTHDENRVGAPTGAGTHAKETS